MTPDGRESGLTSAWPPHVQTIAFVSSADGTRQPAAFYDSGTPGAKPLLVALHTWSYGFCQDQPRVAVVQCSGSTGGHEIIYEAALSWLANTRKG